MKIVELLNKINLPITNEQAKLLELFDDQPTVNKQDLDGRQVVLANQLVNQDVLIRKNENGKIVYKKKIPTGKPY